MSKKKPEPRVKRDLGGLTPKRFQGADSHPSTARSIDRTALKH
jgi:hypothetical protein